MQLDRTEILTLASSKPLQKLASSHITNYLDQILEMPAASCQGRVRDWMQRCFNIFGGGGGLRGQITIQICEALGLFCTRTSVLFFKSDKLIIFCLFVNCSKLFTLKHSEKCTGDINY